MGILYEQTDLIGWAIWLVVLFGLMAFNELARSSKWFGILLFFILPLVLTIFVWPTTAAPGNEYGTGNWFNWVKTYSALAGCLGFMAICYILGLKDKKFAFYFPPIILALNILEAVLRDFQCFSYGAFKGEYINELWVMSGPWNIAYDLWNFAYTYNCIADHSIYCGLALLLSCTIPAFVIKRGMWLQHRAQTLALWIMFIMTFPTFADRIAPVPTTHNPVAFFIVSFVALAFNLGVAIYQFRLIKKNHLNPLKDEIYKDTKAYQEVIEENV